MLKVDMDKGVGGLHVEGDFHEVVTDFTTLAVVGCLEAVKRSGMTLMEVADLMKNGIDMGVKYFCEQGDRDRQPDARA